MTTKVGLKHGDMVYLVAERVNLFSNPTTNSPVISKMDTPTNGSSSYASPKVGSFAANTMGKFLANVDVKEDDVDLQLEKLDGRIARQRDPQLYEKFR